MSTKAQMLAQLKPFPPAISGHIKVVHVRATVLEGLAVDTYVADEYELYFGHQLHCQYRTTDTWRKTTAGWRLIGSQTLALRTDPPAVALSGRQMTEYVGRYSLGPERVYEIRIKDGSLAGTGNRAAA